MVHGGPGGSKDGPADLFVKLADSLAEHDVDSLRFDMLGEGESEGGWRDVTLTSQADQLRTVLRFMRDKGLYDRVGVVAESLGAVAVLLQAWPWPVNLKAAVLLWPALEPERTSLAGLLAPERLRRAAADGFVLDGERQISQALLLDLIAVGRLDRDLRDLQVPVLLVHGDADTEVPFSQSQRALEQLPSTTSRLVIVPGGEHGLSRPQEQVDVVREVTEWLVQHVAT